ncbi:MAG: hypothetical protein AAGK02_12290 [Pseudomonadota bacterium]
MLFAIGKRPTRAALREFTEGQRAVSVSHDPLERPKLQLVNDDDIKASADADMQPPETADIWVELVRDGLTFDLHGIAPGAAQEMPEVEHRFDLQEIPTAFRHDAMRLSLGKHLKGAEKSLPVMRSMIGLARDLTHHFKDVNAIAWSPARSAIGRQYFESVSTAWLEGGPFPALGLTAFRDTIDGAIQSEGLEYWIGQELRIEAPISNDRVAATRLGNRLINHLILLGGIDESERITAPDHTQLVLRPSRNRKFVRVWRE